MKPLIEVTFILSQPLTLAYNLLDTNFTAQLTFIQFSACIDFFTLLASFSRNHSIKVIS